ncbi:MAG: hypothetical protein M3Q58_16465 [Bacteroidota bacterium]|nr:hypothetical protein [Bacteroidota bacterium]
MADKVNYPFYRKYADAKTWFKVISIDEFEELKISEKNFSINKYKATILPDRNFIYDLTTANIAQEASELEYNAQLNYCLSNLLKIAF